MKYIIFILLSNTLIVLMAFSPGTQVDEEAPPFNYVERPIQVSVMDITGAPPDYYENSDDQDYFCTNTAHCYEQGDSCLEPKSEDGDDDVQPTFNDIDCDQLLQYVYTDCGFTLVIDGFDQSARVAWERCHSNDDIWSCMENCSDHTNVDSCSLLEACFNKNCDVEISESEEEEKDDGGCCGG